jgi:hypothetical protein
MTMIVTVGNLDNAILVSDRRLTMADGSWNDESNKAFVLITRDARMAIGFSGLAEVPSLGLRTRFWLPQTLSDCATPDYTLGSILSRLKLRAEKDISSLYVTDRRLSITGVGFWYGSQTPRLAAFRLSNFESLDDPPTLSQSPHDFRLWTWTSNASTPTAELRQISGWRTGPANAIAVWNEIDEWLRIKKNPEAITARAIQMIRLISDWKSAEGRVGSQCMSIVIPNNPADRAVTQYHTTDARASLYLPGHIEARGGDYGVYSIADFEMGAKDQEGKGLTTVVPSVPRNRPCPCGSGRKFKYCHGRKPNNFTIQLGGDC